MILDESLRQNDICPYLCSVISHLFLDHQCVSPTHRQVPCKSQRTWLWWLETSRVDVYCILCNGLASCPGMIDLAIISAVSNLWEDSTFPQFLFYTLDVCKDLDQSGPTPMGRGWACSLPPWWVAILQTNMAINQSLQYDQTIHPPTDLEAMSGIYSSDIHFVWARICAQNMMIFGSISCFFCNWLEYL